MKRREFGQKLVGGAIAAGVAGAPAAAIVPKKNALMHVGADYQRSRRSQSRYDGQGKPGIQPTSRR